MYIFGTTTVRWHVLKEKMTVSEEQMEKFRLLLASDNITDSMAPNFRPIMPLNDRPIYQCKIQLDDDALFDDIDEKVESMLGEQNDDGITEGELKWRIIGYCFIGFSMISLAVCMVALVWICKHWDQICNGDDNPKNEGSKLEVQRSESQINNHDQTIGVIGRSSGHSFGLE